MAAGLRIRPARPPHYRTLGLGHPALPVQRPRQLSQERRGAGQRYYYDDAFGRRIYMSPAASNWPAV